MNTAKVLSALDDVCNSVRQQSSTIDVRVITERLQQLVEIVRLESFLRTTCPNLFQPQRINNVEYQLIVRDVTTQDWSRTDEPHSFTFEWKSNDPTTTAAHTNLKPIKISYFRSKHVAQILVNDHDILFQTGWGWSDLVKKFISDEANDLQINFRSSLSVNDQIDAMDRAGSWYKAQILIIESRRMFVHFINWDERYREWISFGCNRPGQETNCDETHRDTCPAQIAPLNTMTYSTWSTNRYSLKAWNFLRRELKMSPQITNQDLLNAIANYAFSLMLPNPDYDGFSYRGVLLPPGDTRVWYDRWVEEQGQVVLAVQNLHTLIKEYIVDAYSTTK